MKQHLIGFIIANVIFLIGISVHIIWEKYEEPIIGINLKQLYSSKPLETCFNPQKISSLETEIRCWSVPIKVTKITCMGGLMQIEGDTLPKSTIIINKTTQVQADSKGNFKAEIYNPYNQDKRKLLMEANIHGFTGRLEVQL